METQRRIYHVRVSFCRMPSSAMAPYVRVAIMRSLTGPTEKEPKVIRDSLAWEVVQTWERLHLGRSPKGGTAAERTIRTARRIADDLEAKEV